MSTKIKFTPNSLELEFAIDLARKAGRIIKQNFGLGMEKEWKKDKSPLTRTDLSINQLVIDAIAHQFPRHTVLAEEGSVLKDSEFTWACDPLDGTSPFSHGIAIAIFSLALLRNGECILGVAYDPFQDRMFMAEKGKGAFLNGKKIFVLPGKNLRNNVVGASWTVIDEYDLSQAINVLRKRSSRIIDVGSSQYIGVMVAAGEFIATIFGGVQVYDTAAVKILVEEAGGKITDLLGKELVYNEPVCDEKVRGFLATNGEIHNELLKLIKVNLK